MTSQPLSHNSLIFLQYWLWIHRSVHLVQIHCFMLHSKCFMRSAWIGTVRECRLSLWVFVGSLKEQFYFHLWTSQNLFDLSGRRKRRLRHYDFWTLAHHPTLTAWHHLCIPLSSPSRSFSAWFLCCPWALTSSCAGICWAFALIPAQAGRAFKQADAK